MTEYEKTAEVVKINQREGVYMTDKITTEEAISRLKYLWASCPHAEDCKFNMECDSCVDTYRTAIEALEYREPKKPTHKDALHSSCSVCGEDAKVFWKFCPHCGQRLDWSDDE